MNPFSILLFGLPALLAITALALKKRWQVLLNLLAATLIYWYLLPKYVHWNYTHPFNPNDGAALTFAALFGWLFGLIYTTLIYLLARLIKNSIKHYRPSKEPPSDNPQWAKQKVRPYSNKIKPTPQLKATRLLKPKLTTFTKAKCICWNHIQIKNTTYALHK